MDFQTSCQNRASRQNVPKRLPARTDCILFGVAAKLLNTKATRWIVFYKLATSKGKPARTLNALKRFVVCHQKAATNDKAKTRR